MRKGLARENLMRRFGFVQAKVLEVGQDATIANPSDVCLVMSAKLHLG